MKRSLIFVTLAVLGLTALHASEKKYWTLREKVAEAFGADDYDRALASLEGLLVLAPDNPSVHYDLACAYARTDRADFAIRAMTRAVDLGYSSRDQAERDEDLASLRDDPRFRTLLAEMEAREKADTEAFRRPSFREIDPRDVAPFKSWKKLDKEFRKKAAAAEDLKWRGAWSAWREADQAVRNERAAALRRYRDEHPGAKDVERAALDRLEALYGLRDAYPTAFWYGDGPVVVAAADDYLRDFPSGESRAFVAFRRAEAIWFSRTETPPDAKPWRAALPEDVPVGDAAFREVEERHPGTTEAGKAAVMRVLIAYEGAGRKLDDAVRARHQALEPFLEDDAVKAYAERWARSVLIRFTDFSGFEGVDLAGKRWDLAAMKGKVVLIDFWATWCGPCIGELPNLKKAYETYRERGFEIVGVSLDDDDRETFVAWLEKNEVPWPQIYDGKGWETPMARKFGVQGIPFQILLDAEGNVLEGDLRGERVSEALAETLGAAEATPSSSAASPTPVPASPGGR